MAQFKIKIKRESFMTLTVTANDKLNAYVLATQKAKKHDDWSNDVYKVIELTTL